MQKLLFVLVCLCLAMDLASPVWAKDPMPNITDPLATDLPDEMTPDQWSALKAKFKGKGTVERHCCQSWMPKPLCTSSHHLRSLIAGISYFYERLPGRPCGSGVWSRFLSHAVDG